MFGFGISRFAFGNLRADLEEPISAEIFSVERLEQYATSLATTHEVVFAPSSGVSLRKRLRDNAKVLRDAYHTLAAASRDEHSTTPASEWLVDNFHIVDAQIRAIRRDLPSGYYRQLPKLSTGPSRGYPRVYGLVLELVAHTDSRFEPEILHRFCTAYQRVQPLAIGELWAIAISLRVVLIENLRRLATGLIRRREQRERADELADALLAEGDAGLEPSALTLRSLERAALPSALASHLFQRLRDHDPASIAALPWLHGRFAEQQTSAEDVVHKEHQTQGAVNASVRNIITSLRTIASLDWAKFVESVSTVDELLREKSDFGAMDFATRDQYRHAIEELARGAQCAELYVAQRTLALCAKGALDPGFHLLDAGRRALEHDLGFWAPLQLRVLRALRAAGLTGYVSSIVLLTALLISVPLAWAAPALQAPGLLVWFGLLALIPASDAALALVNYWMTNQCPATQLPAMEFAAGVPAELRTVIVVPTLLTHPAEIAEHIEHLEVHHLASPDKELRFALLTDWTDSASESAETDAALLEDAASGIERLNEIYGSVDGSPRFMLFHRRRSWNPKEGQWLGWERKRGKLHEFNRLLLGAADTHFIAVRGRPPIAPSGVRYVITLDADTRLPRGAARALIGKMAHPLNRPQIDDATRRVVRGYGVLQPRVTPSLPSSGTGSIFQSVFSGPSGIDPYAFAVSDVYQDLFGEGSYSGKAIYDVATFEATLAQRVPENSLLSHDLFEGTFARCGLASDIEVIEEYPPRYDVAASRQHRWTRGDWQLLPWILGMERTALPALGRWKMIDNLRRSLSEPFSVVLLVCGWLSANSAMWTVFVLAMIALPPLLPLASSTIPTRDDSWRAYRMRLRRDANQALAQIALQLIFLADRAWRTTDAVLRTLARLLITHRNFLEWTTAAQSKMGRSYALGFFYGRMAGAVFTSVAVSVVCALAVPKFPWVAAPILALWLLSPAIARHISLPRRNPAAEPLNADEVAALRTVARQTWSYFDTFVTAEHNALPPDNYQEIPHAVVARRTSPTNIGLYLLSLVTARDFGWIGLADALDRLEACLRTVNQLERHRGHFYNWYDTHDLRPLDPKYISSVDSGNLAGHLLVLESACREWISGDVLAQQFRRGIHDTVMGVQRCARALEDGRRHYSIPPGRLESALTSLDEELRRTPQDDPVAQLARFTSHADKIVDMAQTLTDERGEGSNAPVLKWAQMLRANIASHARDALAHGAEPQSNAPPQSFRDRLLAIAEQARAIAVTMEFAFLMDPVRQLLSIGYRVAERALDESCYDLLASEARLASFIAIAKGDLPVRHWFLLGRAMTAVHAGAALVSWSGSMFEYLMPAIVMREPPGSLLAETERLIVRRQIDFGDERNLPWGISESAFNARDREFTYQYSNFGVPDLGLKRGLSADAVVAPYATALAAMIDPKAALKNFARLAALGAQGRYGWYEALDFTPLRLPDGKQVVAVRAYMSHHQGMILLSISDVLLEGILRRRFHTDPLVRATELLLQERAPRSVNTTNLVAEAIDPTAAARELVTAEPRRFHSPHHLAPRTHLLSNGSYAVMITAAGSGYSRWRDIAVTRWREDATRDHWGSYIFLRDVGSGAVWSAGYQPIGREPDSYEVAFFEDRAEITRQDGRVTTRLEIVVSPEDDAEGRRVSLTNNGTRIREIETTSYAEVALAPPDADAAHPAFSKLFVQTEFVPEGGILLATRRTRDPKEAPLWLAHVGIVEGESIGGLQFETDRERFIGRGRDLRSPLSIVDARPLSDTVGTVLDAVLALRRRVRIAPGETVRLSFWTAIASTRAQAIQLADKHRDSAAFERAKTMAWTQAQVQLRYLGVDFAEAQLFQRIANRVLYLDPALRGAAEVLARNRHGPSLLWSHGISGDLPILLVRIDSEEDIGIVRQLLRAREYWRLKRLAVDLVILNERPPSYASDLQQGLDATVRTAIARSGSEEEPGRGRVFILRSDLLPQEHIELLITAARAVFFARRGPLVDQVARVGETKIIARSVVAPSAPVENVLTPRSIPELEFFNGLGGFSKDGKEYVTVLDEGQSTPAPWVNVIANPKFGFQVSADGSGNTWSQNAREYQLTPWSNDPVSDTPGEAIYVKDEQTGEIWTPTALPIREHSSAYVIRHGQGYTRFEHSSHEIALELTQFVPLDAAVKISRLTLANRSKRVRRLCVTGYVEWVLAASRAKSAAFLISEIDSTTRALLVRNPWNIEFPGRVAFFDLSGRQQSFTADRGEFLGRHGSLSAPAALHKDSLSNRAGAGLDPCAALQTKIELRAGEEAQLTFLLGDADNSAAAVQLIQRHRAADYPRTLAAVTGFWDETLGAVQVDTPDRAMNLLLNRWLVYQTLACRVWARSAFYQSSGAYGFRDQLQDVMALCIARPYIAREHLLRAAARQFAAGDVQHWWLPSSGQGVRTRISDDRLWLAFVAAHYVDTTADVGVLDEPVPYLEGPELAADQHELFFAPIVGSHQETLFEHCALALETSLSMGQHGLPLFGTGDWNDGMNRVGAGGQGESVWLGWFLYAAIQAFAPLADARGQTERAAQWRERAFSLQQSIEREAWDGDWYRRGYFDDGTPLGSVSNDECRIDSIAQSWAVISGAGEPARQARAMGAVNAQLVSQSDGLVRLFAPPFDHTSHDPGYIKGYPPGIRENGGQYTHGAIWTALAYAKLGDGDRAGELFSLINPINHANSRAGIHRYRVEPYVACADVYTAAPHVGRGGWTWYTGSAGWMYRTALEGIIGCHARGERLLINPCIPRSWGGFQLQYRLGDTSYRISVENPYGVNRGVRNLWIDDRALPVTDGAAEFALVNDGASHAVRIILG
jgi:cyclic beta-1,2-glucan synthetase